MDHEDLSSHRQRAQALMTFILDDKDLKVLRGPHGVHLDLSLAIAELCTSRGVEKFAFRSAAEIGRLSYEQCKVFDEACLMTYGHLWCEFNERPAA